MRQPAVVTDTGSTKREIVDAARALPPRFTFIGGHPLGGAAKAVSSMRGRICSRAPVAADAGPARSGDGTRARRARETVGLRHARSARRPTLAVDAHDRLLAYLSHLPQLTASALMQVVGDAVGQDGLALAGRDWPTRRGWRRAPRNLGRHRRDQRRRNRPGARRADRLLQDLRRDLPRGSGSAEVFDACRAVARAAGEEQGLGIRDSWPRLSQPNARILPTPRR